MATDLHPELSCSAGFAVFSNAALIRRRQISCAMGKPISTRQENSSGGTVDEVDWTVASVTEWGDPQSNPSPGGEVPPGEG